VIEVLVKVGDSVKQEQSLVTLESDKATMEVPAPANGKVLEVKVAVGSKVSQGDVILSLEVEEGSSTAVASEKEAPASAVAGSAAKESSAAEQVVPAGKAEQQASAPAEKDHEYQYDVLVLGSGPGGYTAAFRAADLGLKVALVERYPTLGGVCLNVGCIPSKALLHIAQIIDEAAAMKAHGVSFGEPEIDLEKLRGFKNQVVKKLTDGLAGMAGKRGVDVVQGIGEFTGPNEMLVQSGEEIKQLSFTQAIIAAGSQSFELPGLPWGDPRLMDSTAALDLEDIPARLLVIGGGIIGLEMACVYAALGSKVTVVELTEQLIPGADPDLVKPLQKRINKLYENIFLGTKVTRVDVDDHALIAHFEGPKAPTADSFDRVLVAVGRVPNGKKIGAEAAGVEVSELGYISADRQMRTNVPHIFAIGDIVGQPMLAHKATHEGKVAAEVCAGHKSFFDARVIPSVAYTDPEVAWVGFTEQQAKSDGLDFAVAKFPWAASGRALGNDRTEGFTKLLFDKGTKRIIGAGIVGPHAGDLISECALAIEMDCEAGDIGLTIHPHPTLSESIAMAAEIFDGTITDLYLPKKKK
ncbi:MAG: dihydrolipoyl dehydrogenase, partial [Xanthomonadales bacterium]|nr:dihydrolipoyl dehydrogenase [Xanthomonadales bacterium]